MKGQMWHHSTVTSEKVIIMTEIKWSNLKAIWYSVFQRLYGKVCFKVILITTGPRKTSLKISRFIVVFTKFLHYGVHMSGLAESLCIVYFLDIIIIIINFKDWTLWSVPSPELQLLSPKFLRSSNCSSSLWSVVIWFQRDSKGIAKNATEQNPF
jgi:hypothetical protein